MAHFHVKRKNGRPYLYVREIARVKGKPKVISQVYIGSPEKVRELASGKSGGKKTLKVEEFGALWLANQIDHDIDVAGIVDDVIPRGARETGPTVGEYFWYSILNRMVAPRSKAALSDWYKGTAIQHIRPVAIRELSSKRFWEKWDRVTEEDLHEISQRFFGRVWEVESPEADCALCDTSNYYTYMNSKTESELAQRGKNKDGKHHLRQIGLALLVSRGSRLPLFYRVYPGNRHDSREFEELMDEMFGVLCGLNKTKERLTVVIDKGMNSEGNFSWIDDHSRVHFVTTYSPYFAKDLAAISLDKFSIAETDKNKRLAKEGHEEDRTQAYRTTGMFWGKERVVVVTYTPATARKKEYNLKKKLEQIRQALIEMRAKVREAAPHWRDAEKVKVRYHQLCERLHITSELYDLEFSQNEDKSLSMSFRKNAYKLDKYSNMFGKNIIVTDNTDWSTTDIIEAHLSRYEIEQQFRQSKDNACVQVMPIRHWTDSKIRCHLFTCVVALTYLRRIERALESAGIKRTANAIMEDMRQLHSVLSIPRRSRKPTRRLETPTKTQLVILSAFGYTVDDCGVLQGLSS